MAFENKGLVSGTQEWLFEEAAGGQVSEILLKTAGKYLDRNIKVKATAAPGAITVSNTDHVISADKFTIADTITDGQGYAVTVSDGITVSPVVETAGWISADSNHLDSARTAISGTKYLKASTIDKETVTSTHEDQTITVTSGYAPTNRTITVKAMAAAESEISGGDLTLTSEAVTPELTIATDSDNAKYTTSTTEPTDKYYIKIDATSAATTGSYKVDRDDVVTNITSAGYVPEGDLETIDGVTERGTYTVNAGSADSQYIVLETGSTFAGNAQAGDGKEWTELTSGVVVPEHGFLYISEGYHANEKIALGTLIPDATNNEVAASDKILSGFEAYDQDGKKLVGTIETIDLSKRTQYFTTDTASGVHTIEAGYVPTSVAIKAGSATLSAENATATISTVNITYSDDNSNYVVTGSADISGKAEATVTPGWISSIADADVEGTANLNTTLNAAEIGVSIAEADDLLPVIKAADASADLAGDKVRITSIPSTEGSSSKYYIAVDTSAITDSVKVIPVVDKPGYITASVSGQVEENRVTRNVSAANVAYLPVAAATVNDTYFTTDPTEAPSATANVSQGYVGQATYVKKGSATIGINEPTIRLSFAPNASGGYTATALATMSAKADVTPGWIDDIASVTGVTSEPVSQDIDKAEFDGKTVGTGSHGQALTYDITTKVAGYSALNALDYSIEVYDGSFDII